VVARAYGVGLRIPSILIMRILRPVAVGAGLLVALGLPGAFVAALASPTGSTGAAAILLAWAAVSGMAAGAAFHRASAFRERLPAAPWLLGVFTAMATLLVFARPVLGAIGVSTEDTLLDDSRFFILFTGAAIVAASIFVDVSRRGAGRAGHDAYTLTPGGFRYGTLLVVIGLISFVRPAPGADDAPLPENVEDARRMLADAESTAIAQPRSVSALLRHGLVLSYLDRHDEAVGRLEAAHALDTADVSVTNSLGWAYMNARRFDEAIPHLLRAATEWPNDHQVRYNTARTLMSAGRYDEAEAHYRQLIRMDATHAGAHADLGWVLYRQNHDSAALASVLRGLELDPRMSEIQAFAGTLFQEQAKFSDARARYQIAALQQPTRADFQGMIGIVSYLMQDVRAATDAFDRAWSLDSTWFERSPLANAMRREASLGRTGDISPSAIQAGTPNAGKRP
jgi:Flp pilus assembly protein TadD